MFGDEGYSMDEGGHAGHLTHARLQQAKPPYAIASEIAIIGSAVHFPFFFHITLLLSNIRCLSTSRLLADEKTPSLIFHHVSSPVARFTLVLG